MADLSIQDRGLGLHLLYYGAERAGCSTNLDQLARGMAEGRVPSLAEDGSRTCIELDPIPLPTSTELELEVRVSGPVRGDDDWSLDDILEDVDGIVFVADAGRDRLRHNLLAWADLLEGLRRVQRPLQSLSIVFQINKAGEEHSMAVRDVDTAVNSEGHPSFEANADVGRGVGMCFSEVVRRVIARVSGELRLDQIGVTRGALCGAVDVALVEAGSRAAARLRARGAAAEPIADAAEPERPEEPERSAAPSEAAASEASAETSVVDPEPPQDEPAIESEPREPRTERAAVEASPAFDTGGPQPRALQQLEQGLDKSVVYLRRVFRFIDERTDDPELRALLARSAPVLQYLERVGGQLGSWSRDTEPV